MKKIMFMIPSLGQGGAEKVLVNLVNNINKDKFDVTVITLFDEGENKQFLNPDIHYKSFMKHQFRGNKYYLKLFRSERLYNRIVKDDYDIVISYLEGPTARIISAANCKKVSWIHVEQHTKKNASGSFRSYNEARKCYLRYDKTICVSEYVKNDFKSIFPELDNVDVLYNTNESDQIFEKGKEPVEIEFDNQSIKMCAIGSLKESKGFDRLIRITKKLVNDNLPVKLYILGKGPLEEQLKNQVNELGLTDYVIFLGYQLNPYKYVSKMDLFTCASFAEGFSTAATEALILGVPVVTVKVSGMKEMLGYHNEYGIVTENDEEQLYLALKDIITNKDKLDYYTLKAKERGKFFNKEVTVKAVEEMLENL